MILKFVNKTYLFCWSSVSFTFQISIHQLNLMIQFQHLCSIINVHSDCAILHFNILIMKKSVSSTMTAISSFDQLRLQINFFFEIDFKKLINKWVLNHESNKNQLREILNIFEQAELHVEELNDVVMKVWKMLINEKIWKAKFETKNDVIKMINILFLKNLRACTQSSRNRKKCYIVIIKMKWETNIQDWWFKTLSENYLDNVTSVAKDWIFELISDLIRKIIVNHLQKNSIKLRLNLIDYHKELKRHAITWWEWNQSITFSNVDFESRAYQIQELKHSAIQEMNICSWRNQSWHWVR